MYDERIRIYIKPQPVAGLTKVCIISCLPVCVMTFLLRCSFFSVTLFFFADHQGHVDLYQRTWRRTTKFLWFLSSADRES